MTSILARATSLGTKSCNESQYVGVVLHLYNLLRHFELIEEESVLLEHLCETIGHNIFRGPRPSTNFYSQCVALQGATLQFDKKTRKRQIGFSHIKK